MSGRGVSIAAIAAVAIVCCGCAADPGGPREQRPAAPAGQGDGSVGHEPAAPDPTYWTEERRREASGAPMTEE